MNTGDIEIDPTTRTLLREAAEWRLIGLLFECPDSQWYEQVAALASQVTDATLQAAASRSSGEASEGLYHSTFGPGGPAAVREVSYHEGLMPGAILSEMRGAYKAFDYQSSTGEPPDNIAVQAGFISYLRVKQAYARTRGDAEQCDICEEASRRFIDTHVTVVAHPLAQSLQHSGVEYLALAAEALRARVGASVATSIPLPVLESDEDELSCTL